MNDNGSKFYYSRLTDGEKNLYDRICEALLRFEPALSLHAGMGKAFTVDTGKIMTAVLFDNPVFFYLNRHRVIVKQTPMYIQLIFSVRLHEGRSRTAMGRGRKESRSIYKKPHKAGYESACQAAQCA